MMPTKITAPTLLVVEERLRQPAGSAVRIKPLLIQKSKQLDNSS